MSFDPGDEDQKDSIRDLLEMILLELRLLNTRFEQEFKTEIERRDIDDDNLWFE